MSEDKSSIPPVPPIADTDWFLQSLVNMANTSGVEISITLQAGGLLVSGTLAGGKDYFNGFAEDFSSAFQDPEAVGTVHDAFARYGEIYDKKDGEGVQPPQYIHLKNARFFNTSGKPIPNNKGVWWRGRISEVSGFILGGLSATAG